MIPISISANEFASTPPLKNPKIIIDLKEDTMDFSNASFKKNSTKIANKLDVSLHIQDMAENSRQLVLQFAIINLKNIKAQIGCLINKL